MKLLKSILIFKWLIVVLFLVTPTSALASLPTEKQFTGHVFDQSSDLYYMRARYYDPAIGRFISPDTTGDSLNRYAYVQNSPLRFVDPTGEMVWAGEGLSSSYHPRQSYDFPNPLDPPYPTAHYIDRNVVNQLPGGRGWLLGGREGWGVELRSLKPLAWEIINESPHPLQSDEFYDYVMERISSYGYNQRIKDLQEPLAWLNLPIFDLRIRLRDFGVSNEAEERWYLREFGRANAPWREGLKAYKKALMLHIPAGARIRRGFGVCVPFAILAWATLFWAGEEENYAALGGWWSRYYGQHALVAKPHPEFGALIGDPTGGFTVPYDLGDGRYWGHNTFFSFYYSFTDNFGVFSSSDFPLEKLPGVEADLSRLERLKD